MINIRFCHLHNDTSSYHMYICVYLYMHCTLYIYIYTDIEHAIILFSHRKSLSMCFFFFYIVVHFYLFAMNEKVWKIWSFFASWIYMYIKYLCIIFMFEHSQKHSLMHSCTVSRNYARIYIEWFDGVYQNDTQIITNASSSCIIIFTKLCKC